MNIKQKLVQVIVFYRMFCQWKQLAKEVVKTNRPMPDMPSLVIVPCDPWAVGGSRGDEAMLISVIQRYRQFIPEIPVHIVCADTGIGYIRTLPIKGINPIPSWNGNYSMKRVYQSIIAANPTDVVILGADCMDGFYSPTLSIELLSIYDLCCKTSKLQSHLLGFSFNDTPSWMMVMAFKSLSPDTKICLRDTVSLSRYKKRINSQAYLVADAAFMLQPQFDFPLFYKIKQWTDNRKSEGKIVIGLNFHPMLRTYSGAEDIKSDALLLARNIEQILVMHTDICFVLIPHDDRPNLTDNLVLSTIYEYLSGLKIGGQLVYYSSEVPRASQLKALCGLLDGLISSRMHLAIAALGMGVPVMAATYQGKFEGLFELFCLDQSFLLNPSRFLSDDMVYAFDIFKHNLLKLKQQISIRIPYVQELSNANLRLECQPLR